MAEVCSEDTLPESPGRGSRKPFFLGVAVGCAASLMLALVCVSVPALLWLLARDGGGNASEMPRFELEVASDGCGVIRSEPPGGPPDMLTWVVKDKEGFQVLGRGAGGETRYRYFAAGDYDVVLQAHDGEKYGDVSSNTVSIECP